MNSSDMFGIAPALRAMMQFFTVSSRRSGRTTRLVEALKTGDRVIVATDPEARHLLGLVRQRKLTVEIRVVDPAQLRDEIYCMKPSQGRTYFDHTWIERYYANTIDRVAEDLARTEARLSNNPYIQPDLTRYQK